MSRQVSQFENGFGTVRFSRLTEWHEEGYFFLTSNRSGVPVNP